MIACTGGTGVGGSDDVAAVVEVARAEGLHVHLDAAWAGAAMIVPEFRDLWAGADGVDSLVFNPHKWMGAQFDCCAHFIREPDALRRTLAIRPDYLRTPGREQVIDYSEMSIPLGRRFRALKLWFLIRTYGLEGLRAIIRDHVAWSRALAGRLRAEPDFQITSEPVLSLFSFRYAPPGAHDLDAINDRLLQAINDDGRIYLTPTVLDGRRVIRFQTGQFGAEERDVDTAFEVITQVARDLDWGAA